MSEILERIWRREAPVWAKPLEAPLALASVVYGWGQRWASRRKLARAERLPRPVLSVGNLTVGGTGKTPVVQFLAEAAREEGARAAVLSRGYGSREAAPRRVDSQESDWEVYGDEPLLLARNLPETAVWVGHDRVESGRRALREDPAIELFLLDDGFQHRRLIRDYDLVLIDEKRGLGNGRLLPWGPLREPAAALERADCVAIVSKAGSSEGLGSKVPFLDRGTRIELGPTGWTEIGADDSRPLADLPRSTPFHLVAGIGAPKSFEDSARECELEVVGCSIFPDHHPFSIAEIEGARELGRKHGARLATTAKDAIRIENLPIPWTDADRPIIIQLGLKQGDGSDMLKGIVKELLAKKRENANEISGGRTSS